MKKKQNILFKHFLITFLAIAIIVACTPTKVSAGSKTIAPGTYNIITAINTNMAIDVPGGAHFCPVNSFKYITKTTQPRKP